MAFTDILHRLVAEGIVPGVFSVLSFIPTIAVMIFFLSLFRECGILRGTAAHLIMGFSCSVPAILSCSGIPDRKQRFLTMMMIPYMSCSAKLPIYAMMASMFFPRHPYIAVGGIYALGVLITLTVFSAAKLGALPPACSYPSYSPSHSPSCKGHAFTSPGRPKKCRALHRPSMRRILDDVRDCCIGFVKKAFTVILAASVIIWILQNLNTSFHFTPDIEDSLLAHLGRLTAPLLEPLGFGDWRASAALITGLSAKEAVVSTFAVIAGSAEGPALCMMLEEIFSPLSAFCFMVFCLLYMPCIATLAAMKSVTGRLTVSLAVMAGQTAFAWVLSFLIFHLIKVII